MKSRQVGYVLIALIVIGIAGLFYRIVIGGTDEFILEGLLPISEDIINQVDIKTNDGFWPGIPYDVATALSPTHIFLVIAQPEEIANTVLWLCKKDAASITGQAISISGGEVMS